MKKLRLTFAISSLTFLVMLAISPLKDFFREWKWYQYEYNELVSDLPQRVKPAEIGIKQLWIQKKAVGAIFRKGHLRKSPSWFLFLAPPRS